MIFGNVNDYTGAECGVYAIHDVRSGLRYIGSSKNIKNRIASHIYKLSQGRHHSKGLQALWDVKGEVAFESYALEIVADKERLIEREQYWIDFFDTINRGLNSLPAGAVPDFVSFKGYKKKRERKALLCFDAEQEEAAKEAIISICLQEQREAKTLQQKGYKRRKRELHYHHA